MHAGWIEKDATSLVCIVNVSALGHFDWCLVCQNTGDKLSMSSGNEEIKLSAVIEKTPE